MDRSPRPGPFHNRMRPATALPATTDSRSTDLSSPAFGWRMATGLIGAAGVVFGLVFHHDVAAAVQVWIGSTAYNHCFLILPLIGFLLWERRTAITSVSPVPAFWPLVLMPLLSVVWLVAAVLDINEGRQLAVVAMFEIVLLVTLGPRVFRRLLAPLLFLFFLVPTGAFLVPTLQKITADIVVVGLNALHIPVFSDGFMIEIPEGSFEIAEACAGLRFLIASSVFGCFFAVVMYRSFVRRALFIALSVSVPIAANGMRALGIILLAHLEGSAAAVEADHILYGWIFFSLVILLLIAIGMAFAGGADRSRPLQATPVTNPSLWRFALAAPAAVLLALTGPAYAARLDSRFAAPALPPLAGVPAVDPPWHILPASGVNWRPVVHGADRQFLQSFKEPGSGVVVRYVALYHLRAVGNTLTNTDNRIADDHIWRVTEQGPAEVSVGGEKVEVISTQIVSGPYRRLVWSFFLVDGKMAAGLLRAKLLQARAVLLRRAPVAAFVAVSASMDDLGDRAQDQLEGFLRAAQPLTRYLDRLSRENDPAGGASNAKQ
jgi:exosortase A